MSKDLEERIASLEREISELKSAPKVENHYHYHYNNQYPTYGYPYTYPPHVTYTYCQVTSVGTGTSGGTHQSVS